MDTQSEAHWVQAKGVGSLVVHGLCGELGELVLFISNQNSCTVTIGNVVYILIPVCVCV